MLIVMLLHHHLVDEPSKLAFSVMHFNLYLTLKLFRMQSSHITDRRFCSIRYPVEPRYVIDRILAFKEPLHGK